MVFNKTSLTFDSPRYLQDICRVIMPSKRSVSPHLVAQTSNCHSSVTLYGLETPRRSKRIKVEDNIVDLEDIVESKPKISVEKIEGSSKKATAKSPKKLKPIQQALEKPHPAPLKWEETYHAIKQMRSRIVAPVDTMGCDQAQLKESDPKVCTPTTLGIKIVYPKFIFTE